MARINPLVLDSGNAFITPHGITRTQFDGLEETLTACRADVLAEGARTEAQTSSGCGGISQPTQRSAASLLEMPERMLDAYQCDRANSQLGRILKTANRLAKTVDKVVVLSVDGFSAAARALMEACCHPYHNELGRGQRGGRPRMYFDGSDCDNDRLQGLLDFLAIDGNGDGPESKWAIVMISQSGETLETLASFGLFYSRLKTAVGEHRVAEYIVPVTNEASELAALAGVMDCNERFLIPEGVSRPLTALSAAGILPAAILGIDVVKLLESAAAMNTHFRTAPMGRNVVMDYVAVNHLLENANGGSSWELAVWSRSLVSAGGWYKQLLTTSLGTHRENPPTRVINNLILKSWRRDHLVIEKSNWDHDRLNSMAGKTWPQMNEAAVRGTSQALVEAGQPTMNLFMHAADEEGLGQLFQMMMLAMFLHRRLLGG